MSRLCLGEMQHLHHFFFLFFFGSHYWFAATVKLHGYNQRPSKSFLHACRGCAVQPRDKTLHQWDQTRFATIWSYWKTLFNHLSASHRLQFTQDSQSSSRHEKRRFIHIISSWFRLKSYLLGVAGAHLIKCCGNGWSAVVERPRFVSWADTQTSEGIRKLFFTIFLFFSFTKYSQTEKKVFAASGLSL